MKIAWDEKARNKKKNKNNIFFKTEMLNDTKTLYKQQD